LLIGPDADTREYNHFSKGFQPWLIDLDDRGDTVARSPVQRLMASRIKRLAHVAEFGVAKTLEHLDELPDEHLVHVIGEFGAADQPEEPVQPSDHRPLVTLRQLAICGIQSPSELGDAVIALERAHNMRDDLVELLTQHCANSCHGCVLGHLRFRTGVVGLSDCGLGVDVAGLERFHFGHSEFA
jgi:hypothetical protein